MMRIYLKCPILPVFTGTFDMNHESSLDEDEKEEEILFLLEAPLKEMYKSVLAS